MSTLKESNGENNIIARFFFWRMTARMKSTWKEVLSQAEIRHRGC